MSDNAVLLENTEEQAACWICLDSNVDSNIDELFRPCRCNGTIGLVHRQCLDEWRAVNEMANRCPNCRYQYRIVLVHDDTNCLDAIIKFLAKNFCYFLVINQLLIIIVSYLVQLVDHSRLIAREFNPAFGAPSNETPTYKSTFNSVYYILASFIVLVGWSSLLLLNLYFIKNRRNYVQAFWDTGVHNCYCEILVFMFLIVSYMLPLLGTFVLSAMINHVFTRHCKFQDNLRTTRKYIVLNYVEQPSPVRPISAPPILVNPNIGVEESNPERI